MRHAIAFLFLLLGTVIVYDGKGQQTHKFENSGEPQAESGMVRFVQAVGNKRVTHLIALPPTHRVSFE